jgi:hypothetical protein
MGGTDFKRQLSAEQLGSEPAGTLVALAGQQRWWGRPSAINDLHRSRATSRTPLPAAWVTTRANTASRAPLSLPRAITSGSSTFTWDLSTDAGTDEAGVGYANHRVMSDDARGLAVVAARPGRP